MTENQLLNSTLEILENEGAEQAYTYIVEKKKEVNSYSSQIYNFLYCLAAVCGKREEALSLLEEAIIKNKYWYRPEVFDDSDLESLYEDPRFINCKFISARRYLAANKTAKTICTWKEVSSTKLLLALHGNQQNIHMCKENWDFMKEYGYQVEYVQSCELDSCHLYRWEDNGSGDSQLEEVIQAIDWNSYEEHILCGFSAGCNVILKALTKYDFKCVQIIFQSPWIPIIKENLKEILLALKEKQISILIICGENDQDCRPLAEYFSKEAAEDGIPIKEVWVKGLSHDFPDNFKEILEQNLLEHDN